MKEILVTIAALILSFFVGIWTGDGTFFVGVVMFSFLALVGTVIGNRHNDT